MKRTITLALLLTAFLFSYSQAEDTISTNIYQKGGYLGIGNYNPESLLHILTDGSNKDDRNMLKLHNTSTSGLAFTGIKLYTGDNSKFSSIANMGLTYNASPAYDIAGFLTLSNNSRGVILHAHSDRGTIKMYTGYDPSAGAGIERMRIDSVGNVGIGTDSPQAKIQVSDGDIYISDINRGIIMKSPDGNCWRGVLNNNGQLTFTQTKCPEGDSESASVESATISTTEISIFPNPTNGEFIIEMNDNDIKQTLEYAIYTIDGKMAKTNNISSKYTKVDISAFATGTYFVQIKNQNNELVKTQEIIRK